MLFSFIILFLCQWHHLYPWYSAPSCWLVVHQGRPSYNPLHLKASTYAPDFPVFPQPFCDPLRSSRLWIYFTFFLNLLYFFKTSQEDQIAKKNKARLLTQKFCLPGARGSPCNPSNPRGTDQEARGSKPAWVNSSRDPILKNPSQIGVVEWFKVKALSSSPVLG
jgi:hypothetical protein